MASRTFIASRSSIAVTFLIVLVMAAGCASAVSPSPSPGPPRSEIELKAALIDAFGPLWYCDPDSYPVGRDEMGAMKERWAEVTADPTTLEVAAGLAGIETGIQATDEQRLAVYRAWKMLNAVLLEEQGQAFRFDYLAQPATGTTEGRRVMGAIAADGSIAIEQDAPAGEPMCPICLVRGTSIASPGGDIAVEDVRPGTIVWTVDLAGRRVAATVVDVGRVAVGSGRSAVRVELSDGRSLVASAGHPVADGRTIGSLDVGEDVDGSTVTAIANVPNVDGWTFDLLPAGDTHAYWADGVLVGSTLSAD